MITEKSGNLLLDDADALVNTVNTVGVMGKGLALQFKRAYPDNFEAYRAACARGSVVPGKIFSTRLVDGRWILNFPTKRHWRERSRLADIESGLVALAKVIDELGLRSVAIPPLGCGNGGLEWSVVRALIMDRLGGTDCEIRLYGLGTPDPRDMPVDPRPPRMNLRRSRLLHAVRAYATASLFAGVAIDTATSLVEVHKTVYLLQAAGLDLGYRFERGKYGPVSFDLNRELAGLEGHYLVGYGDGTGGARADLELLPAGLEACASGDPEFDRAWGAVAEAISGYEYPDGMELLGTVHFVAAEAATFDVDEVARLVASWNQRKRALFSRADIGQALAHLRTTAVLTG
ncbi:macro domain-containing protein [Actinocorallia sp. API 0066]|uniref:type II toxin-antitoxin system antitoxin DNA ADP-ribosyl glycohydrolase DarG n=1 Tax=Actinocorallia sp. API 0066 TaxID=2896846 RepID=UPI001E305320|nr:macro domain-containing protein [Actinocorallia sp. API 0066]MCD0451181.1 macro domain-containing protein [Actinocorallia sp. API 0066]